MKNVIKLIAILIFLLGGSVLVIAELIESFKYYPASNTLLRSAFTTFDDSLTNTRKDTADYKYYNIDVGYASQGRYKTILSLYVNAIIELRNSDTIGTNPNLRWWIDGKDTTKTYKIITDTQFITAGTTFVVDTLAGFVKLDSIQYLPAQLRFGLVSDSASGIMRVNSATYFEPTFKTLE